LSSGVTKAFLGRRNHPQVLFPIRCSPLALVLALALFSVGSKPEQEQAQEQEADLDLRLFSEKNIGFSELSSQSRLDRPSDYFVTAR
jgi:hypothetical protein